MLGLSPGEADDPYSAMAELCQNPDGYDAVVLSLQGLHREELQIIPAIKTHLPHVEVWLTDLDGRSAALAEAMRLEPWTACSAMTGCTASANRRMRRFRRFRHPVHRHSSRPAPKTSSRRRWSARCGRTLRR